MTATTVNRWAGAFATKAPPESFFAISAVFHYLGPAFAVLLFARVDVLGVAWLRIASAALIFAVWRKPWRAYAALDSDGRRVLIAWGAVLAVMNCIFYSAIDRLPLGTVAAIEFLPVIVLAAIGMRTPRNLAALAMAVAGVYLLTDVVLEGEPLGVALAAANAVLFALYIVLGAKVAERGAGAGIDALAASMLIAAVVVTPIGGWAVLPALERPGRDRRRHRRRRVVIGHPVRVRPARAGADDALDLRADGLAAARHGHGDRDRRAAQLPTAVEVAGRRARGRGRRRAPRAGTSAFGGTSSATCSAAARAAPACARRAPTARGSRTWRASASPNSSSSPSTVSARMPKAVASAAKSGVWRSTP